MAFGTPDVNVRIRATIDDFSKKMSRVEREVSALEKRFGSLGRVAKGAFATFIGVEAGRAVASGLNAAFEAADEATRAFRLLGATSKLTGASLEDLTRVAKDAQRAFALSAPAASDLIAELTRLTSKAGQIERTGDALRAFLDLGAARGLDAVRVLDAIRTTVIGQDEGLNRLGLANPSGLYAEWARSAGVAASKMDDVQKAQAILDAVIREGGKVRGEYDRFLDDLPGKQAKANQRLEEAQAALGNAFAPTRLAAIEAMTSAFESMADAIERNQKGIQSILAVGGGVVDAAGFVASIFRPFNHPESLASNLDRQRNPVAVSFGDVSRLPNARRMDENAALIGFDQSLAATERIADRMEEIANSPAITRPPSPIDDKAAERAAEELRRALEALDETIRKQTTLGITDTGRAGVPLTEEGRQRFLDAQRRRRQFTEAGGRLTPVAVPDIALPAGELSEESRDLARNLTDAARGLVDLGDATGLLGDRSRRALSGLTGLISSLSGLKGASGLGLASGLLGLAGGAAQLLAGAFDDSERRALQREHNDILRRNTEAIERLGVNLTANTYASVGRFLEFASQPGTGAIEGATLFDTIELAGLGSGSQFDQQMKFLLPVLEQFGLTFADLNELAEANGLQLLDSNGEIVADTLRQLFQTMGPVIDRLTKFGDTVADQTTILDARREIFDITDPAALAQDQLAVLAKFAPQLFGDLANLDLGSAEARAVFERRLREVFEQLVSAAGLSPEALGEFLDKDSFLAALLGADRALDAFAESAKEATSAMHNVPEVLNLALLRYRASVVGTGGSGTPLGPENPATDPGGGWPGGERPAASSIVVEGDINVYGVEDVDGMTAEVEKRVARRASAGPTRVSRSTSRRY